MNVYLVKIILIFLLLLISIIVNMILFYKSDKKYCLIAELLIVSMGLLYYILDCLLFQSELTDYIASIMLLSFLLSITFEDIKTKMMDTRVIIGYFILFFIYRIIFLNMTIFVEGFVGFALSLAIMLLAYFIKKKSIGIGDVEVIATCGMIIGFPNIFHFLFKTFLFVFLYSIYLFFVKKIKNNERRKKEQPTEIPLAPFLLLATII